MDVMTRYGPALQRCGVFKGLAPQHCREALGCLRAEVQHYSRRSPIVELRQRPCRSGIVLSGMMEAFFYDEAGNRVCLCRFGSGEWFLPELSCPAGGGSPVCLLAHSACTALLVDLDILLSPASCKCPYRMQVAASLMQSMARQMLFFNTKIRILAQKRLRERLRLYLQTLAPDTDGCYTLPYSRSELADFLCVDRSALSRELCRMRDQQILTFSGRKLRFLSSDFLAR